MPALLMGIVCLPGCAQCTRGRRQELEAALQAMDGTARTFRVEGYSLRLRGGAIEVRPDPAPDDGVFDSARFDTLIGKEVARRLRLRNRPGFELTVARREVLLRTPVHLTRREMADVVAATLDVAGVRRVIVDPDE